MDLDNNVYIKYLGKEDNPSGYWKYIIDDIEYYIPNYGYMVIIDSNYRDLEKSNNTLNVGYETNGIYGRDKPPKIWSSYIYQSSSTPEDCDKEDNIKKDIKKNMKNIFDSDNFSTEHKHYGGIEPPTQIISVINRINEELKKGNDSSDIKFKKLFVENFSNFLHNKIGSYITKDEKEFVEDQQLEINPKVGKLYVDSNDKFVLYVGKYKEDPIERVEEVAGAVEEGAAVAGAAAAVEEGEGAAAAVEAAVGEEVEEEVEEREERLSLKDDIILTRKSKIGENNINLENRSIISIRKYKSRYPIEQDYKLVDGKFTADNLIDTYFIKEKK